MLVGTQQIVKNPRWQPWEVSEIEIVFVLETLVEQSASLVLFQLPTNSKEPRRTDILHRLFGVNGNIIRTHESVKTILAWHAN